MLLRLSQRAYLLCAYMLSRNLRFSFNISHFRFLVGVDQSSFHLDFATADGSCQEWSSPWRSVPKGRALELPLKTLSLSGEGVQAGVGLVSSASRKVHGTTAGR